MVASKYSFEILNFQAMHQNGHIMQSVFKSQPCEGIKLAVVGSRVCADIR